MTSPAAPACASVDVKYETQLPVCAGGSAWAGVTASPVTNPTTESTEARETRMSILLFVGLHERLNRDRKRDQPQVLVPTRTGGPREVAQR